MDNLISTHRNELLVVSWNLHKGRSLLGLRVWRSMRTWLTTIPADVFFFQEAMAQRVSMSLDDKNSKYPDNSIVEGWHCQATEIAVRSHLQIALGQNVLKRSSRYGNAILSPYPLNLSGRWDISAHRFERRGLLAARMNRYGSIINLLCVHLALTRTARIRQMEWIAEWIENGVSQEPIILAGDFNDWKNDSVPIFGAIDMEEVAVSLGLSGYTFPAFLPALGLDKMFIRGLTPRAWSGSPETAWLSDHQPYIARLIID